MLLPQYTLNATNILFLVHTLLLSSTETLLIILYDPDCSHLTTAILRQTYTHSIVAYQITNSTSVESLHQSNIIDNAIIISIFGRNRPSIAQQTLTRYYNHFYINRKFTHFCLIHTTNYHDKKMEMTDFIRSFLKLNVRMVPVLIAKRKADYDFNVFTSSSSWSYSPSTQTLSTEYSSSFLMQQEDKHLNMNQLLVPVINIQNLSAYYFCSDYNAPHAYRVRAFSENVTLFVGGTEVRMLNLIAERMKWNVQFCLPPSKPPYYQMDNFNEVDSTFYNRIVRTSMARIKQYSLETAKCNG